MPYLCVAIKSGSDFFNLARISVQPAPGSLSRPISCSRRQDPGAGAGVEIGQVRPVRAGRLAASPPLGADFGLYLNGDDFGLELSSMSHIGLLHRPETVCIFFRRDQFLGRLQMNQTSEPFGKAACCRTHDKFSRTAWAQF